MIKFKRKNFQCQLDSHLEGPLEVENVVKSRDSKITYTIISAKDLTQVMKAFAAPGILAALSP